MQIDPRQVVDQKWPGVVFHPMTFSPLLFPSPLSHIVALEPSGERSPEPVVREQSLSEHLRSAGVGNDPARDPAPPAVST